MAKVKINWPPMSMKAEGEDAAVLAQAEQFLKYVKEANKISFDVLPTIFRDGCRDPEEGVGEPECVGCNDDCESCETYEKANSVKPLTEPEEVAPGAQWDVVAIYDNAGTTARHTVGAIRWFRCTADRAKTAQRHGRHSSTRRTAGGKRSDDHCSVRDAHYPVRHSTSGGSIFLLGVRYGF